MLHVSIWAVQWVLLVEVHFGCHLCNNKLLNVTADLSLAILMHWNFILKKYTAAELQKSLQSIGFYLLKWCGYRGLPENSLVQQLRSTKLSQHVQMGHFSFGSLHEIFNILVPNFPLCKVEIMTPIHTGLWEPHTEVFLYRNAASSDRLVTNLLWSHQKENIWDS